jgi:outer membrane receptor protein involved in Fe transport
VSARYQPFDPKWIGALTFRATYSEAFHVPYLNETTTAVSESAPPINDPTGTLGGSKTYQPRELLSGNPNLKPETAYEWSYGGVYSPKWISGLTFSLDFYHIHLRDVVSPFSVQDAINNPTVFPQVTIIRESGGENTILEIFDPEFNLASVVVEGADFELAYIMDSTIFGLGNFGTFTTTVNGNYASRFTFQSLPGGKSFNIIGRFVDFGSQPHWRAYGSVFWDGPTGGWMQGIDAGVIVHFTSQYRDETPIKTPGLSDFTTDGNFRKVKEWITADAILSYRFNLPPPVAQQEVAGYAKDGGKNVKMKDGKDKNVMPVSTAEYNPCGWRAWLNGTTITLGMNNITDENPPYVAGSGSYGDPNGYDQSIADARGRFYYVSLKKNF